MKRKTLLYFIGLAVLIFFGLIFIYFQKPTFFKMNIQSHHSVGIVTENLDPLLLISGNKVPAAIHQRCNNSGIEKGDIPKVYHGVFLGGNFRFHHYVSLISIWKKVKPHKIYLHGYDFPLENQLLQKAIHLTGTVLVPARQLSEIYDRPVNLVEHKADIVRLETIIQFGGFYADLDVIFLKEIDELLGHETVLGKESDFGVNNGIMFGKQCAPFLLEWYSRYKTFNDSQWASHSVRLPYQMIYKEKFPGAHVEETFLNRPNYLETDFLYKEEKENGWDFSKNYAVHLWYRFYRVEHNEVSIKSLKNAYGRIVRHILWDEKL